MMANKKVYLMILSILVCVSIASSSATNGILDQKSVIILIGSATDTLTTPPPADTSPPPTDTSPPPGDTSSPPTDTSPPPTDTSPPPTDTSPPPTDTSPPPTDTSPPPTDTSPPPTDTSPPLTDTSPSPSSDSTRSSSSGGSSSGGGGGGIISGENFSNIDIVEKYDLPIYKDITTSYRFADERNPILFVNITGNVTSDIITTSVEVLKGQSTLVTAAQTDIVYMNVNIWVGLSGFAVPRNIKEGKIKFGVENSWINNNNLLRSDIKLQRWNGNEWLVLETSEKSTDSKFTYYEADTKNFSSFAITALKGEPTLMDALLPGKTSVEKEGKLLAKKTENRPQEKSGFLMKWFLISGIFIVIGLIIEVYLSVRKKKNIRQFST